MKLYSKEKTYSPKKKNKKKFKKEKSKLQMKKSFDKNLKQNQARIKIPPNYHAKSCATKNSASIISNPMLELEEDREFERLMNQNFEYDPVSKKYFARKTPDMIKLEEDSSLPEKLQKMNEVPSKLFSDIFYIRSFQDVFQPRKSILFIKNRHTDKTQQNIIDFEKRCSVLLELVSKNDWAQTLEENFTVYRNVDLTNGFEQQKENIQKKKFLALKQNEAESFVALTVGFNPIVGFNLRIRIAYISKKAAKPSIIKLEPKHLEYHNFKSCYLIDNNETSLFQNKISLTVVIVTLNVITVIRLYLNEAESLTLRDIKDIDVPPIRSSKLLRPTSEILLLGYSGSSFYKFDIPTQKVAKCLQFLPYELRFDMFVPLIKNDLVFLYTENKKILLCDSKRLYFKLVLTNVVNMKRLSETPGRAYISYINALGCYSLLCLSKNGCEESWNCHSISVGSLFDNLFSSVQFRLNHDCYAYFFFGSHSRKVTCLLFDFSSKMVYKTETKTELNNRKLITERKVSVINDSRAFVFFERNTRTSSLLNIIQI